MRVATGRFDSGKEALKFAQKAYEQGNVDEAHEAIVEALERIDEFAEDSIDSLLTLQYLLADKLCFAKPPDQEPCWSGIWSSNRRFYMRSRDVGDDTVLQVCGAGAVGLLAEEKFSAPLITYDFLQPLTKDGPLEALAIISHSTKGATLCRWHEFDGFNQQQIRGLPFYDSIEAVKPVALSPKGELVFLALKMADYASATSFILCDLRKNECVDLPFKTKGGLRAGFSPDGSYLGLVPVHACGEQDETPTLVVEVATGKTIELLHGDVARGMAWSPTGRYLALYVEPFLYRGTIRVFDVASRKVVSEIEGLRDPDEDHSCAESAYFAYADHDRSSTMVWDDGGNRLYVYDRDKEHYLELEVPGMETGEALSPPRIEVHQSKLSPIALPQGTPLHELHFQGGRYVLVGFENLQAVLWDLEKKCILFRGSTPSALKPEWTKVSVSQKFVLVNDDSCPWLIYVSDGRLERLKDKSSFQNALDFTLRPCGEEIAVRQVSELYLFDLGKEDSLWKVPLEKGDKAVALWAPDGVTLLLFEMAQNSVTLLDGLEGYELAKWPWYYGHPHEVTFSSAAAAQKMSFLIETRIGKVRLRPGVTKPKLLSENGPFEDDEEPSLFEKASDYLRSLFDE